MPDTEADRILREQRLKREKEHYEAYKRSAGEFKRERAKAEQYYARQLPAEISAVLELLKKYNYPFMEEHRVMEYSRLARFLNHLMGISDYDSACTISYKAAWEITSIPYETYDYDTGRIDVPHSYPVYLLSDGRICSGGSSGKLYVIDITRGVPDVDSCLLQGLQKLRMKLENLGS